MPEVLRMKRMAMAAFTVWFGLVPSLLWGQSDFYRGKLITLIQDSTPGGVGPDEGSHLSEMELRVRAIETILVEKGYIETAALDRIVELYETKIGPHIGAQG